jgi:hypothetical protein
MSFHNAKGQFGEGLIQIRTLMTHWIIWRGNQTLLPATRRKEFYIRVGKHQKPDAGRYVQLSLTKSTFSGGSDIYDESPAIATISACLPGASTPISSQTRRDARCGFQCAERRLRRQPRPRRDDQCLNTGSQSRMDDRRKLWAVIDRKFIQPIISLGFRIDRWISAAHKPKY